MGLEHLLQLLLRHSRAFVVDMQDEGLAVVFHLQVGAIAILEGIVQQVADAAFQRQRLAQQGAPGFSGEAHPRWLLLGEGLHQLQQQRLQVDRLQILVDVGVLDALQGALDQQVQLVKIAHQLGLHHLVVHQLGAQAQPGNGRAQVVGDGAEQLGALVQVTGDAFPHGVEGAGDLADLLGALLAHRRRMHLQRQLSRGTRQPLERATLPADQQADEQQQEGAAEDHEQQLLQRQPGLVQAVVGRRHEGGEIHPLPFADADLGHQHRRLQRLQTQGVVRPGARQFVERHGAVEQPQLLRADEFDVHRHGRAQAFAQYRLDPLEHRPAAGRIRQRLHGQRLFVERDEEARAAHVAQLLQHQRPIGRRQQAEVAHAGGDGIAQAAGRRLQALVAVAAQGGGPEQCRGTLGQEHRQQGQEQHPRQQGTRHQPREQTATPHRRPVR